MTKILNDKYYTPKDLANRLIQTTISELVKYGVNNISDIIEPSAGNGSFSSQIKCTAYDIEPEDEGIIKADFLQEPIEYKKGRDKVKGVCKFALPFFVTINTERSRHYGC